MLVWWIRSWFIASHCVRSHICHGLRVGLWHILHWLCVCIPKSIFRCSFRKDVGVKGFAIQEQRCCHKQRCFQSWFSKRLAALKHMESSAQDRRLTHSFLLLIHHCYDEGHCSSSCCMANPFINVATDYVETLHLVCWMLKVWLGLRTQKTFS